MYTIKITGFDGYPAEREWFNWKDFHSLLVVLDKAQSSNLAFRMSVTRKWGIPKAHYMPVRGVTEACASFDSSLKTFQTHFPPLNMVWTHLHLNVIKIHYNRLIMYSMYRQKDELPDYDGQSSLFGVKRKMQQCTKDHLLSLWCIPLFICRPPIFSIWHSIYFHHLNMKKRFPHSPDSCFQTLQMKSVSLFWQKATIETTSPTVCIVVHLWLRMRSARVCASIVFDSVASAWLQQLVCMCMSVWRPWVSRKVPSNKIIIVKARLAVDHLWVLKQIEPSNRVRTLQWKSRKYIFRYKNKHLVHVNIYFCIYL